MGVEKNAHQGVVSTVVHVVGRQGKMFPNMKYWGVHIGTFVVPFMYDVQSVFIAVRMGFFGVGTPSCPCKGVVGRLRGVTDFAVQMLVCHA